MKFSLTQRLFFCLSLSVFNACQATPTLPERQSVSFEPDLLDPLGPPPAVNNFDANLPNQLPVFDFLKQGNQVTLNLTQFNQEGQQKSPVPTTISLSAQDDTHALQRTDLKLSAFSLARLLEPELSLNLPEYGQVIAPLQPSGQDRSRLQQTVLISTYESQGKQLLTDPNCFVISGQQSFLDSLTNRALRLMPDSKSPDLKQETLQQIWLEGVQLPITHAAINAKGELLLELDMVRRYLFGSALAKQQAQVSFRQADYNSTKEQLRTLILREPQTYLSNLAEQPSQFSVVQVRLNNRPINLNATLSALTSAEREQFQIKRDGLLKTTDHSLLSYLDNRRRTFRLATLSYNTTAQSALDLPLRQFGSLRGSGLSLLARQGQFAERSLALITRKKDGRFATYRLVLTAEQLRQLARKLDARYFKAQQMQTMKYLQLQRESQTDNVQEREAAFQRWTQGLSLAELVKDQGDDLSLPMGFSATESQPDTLSANYPRASDALLGVMRQELTQDLQSELQDALGYLTDNAPPRLNLNSAPLTASLSWVDAQVPQADFQAVLNQSETQSKQVEQAYLDAAAEELALRDLLRSGVIPAERVIFQTRSASPTLPTTAPSNLPQSGGGGGSGSSGSENSLPNTENIESSLEFEFG